MFAQFQYTDVYYFYINIITSKSNYTYLEICKCAKKSSTAQSLVLANTIDEVLEHYILVLTELRIETLPKISRQKIYTKAELYGKANSIVL
jgi:hypothetical protein